MIWEANRSNEGKTLNFRKPSDQQEKIPPAKETLLNGKRQKGQNQKSAPRAKVLPTYRARGGKLLLREKGLTPREPTHAKGKGILTPNPNNGNW